MHNVNQFSVNPITGGMFFSIGDLKNMMLVDTNSSLMKYRREVSNILREKNYTPDEITDQVNLQTADLSFAACVYCQVDKNDNFSSTHGYMLFSKETAKTTTWTATLALKLETDAVSSPTFIVFTADVITLRVDGEKSYPIILAESRQADRIAKIVGRSSTGRPFMERVR